MAMAAEPILASTLWTLHRVPLAPTVTSSQSKKLPTGHRSLDNTLGGGLDHGRLSCLSAEAESGTSDIMQAVLISHLLSAPNATATVIDTTLAFDLRNLHGKLVRVLQVQGKDGAEAMGVLKRLTIMKVFDFIGLTESVTEFREALEFEDASAPRGEPPPRGTVADSEDEDDMLDEPTPPSMSTLPKVPSLRVPSLLVIDSISQAAAPLLKSNHVQGQALLTSFMRSLAHLTRTYGLCTLLLNGVTSYSQSREETPSIFSSCVLRPALSKTFASLVDLHMLVHAIPKTAADARIVYGSRHEIKRGAEPEVVEVIEVLQDRYSGKVGRWTSFAISDDRDMIGMS
ncbi:hypothetical protein LTR56_021955 [Elasticomyces elasticus]|nr:hypothetical protein LTR56_021955 [Elasticomyces elasticus]KAK3629666.1 hypothetical protein LTR22_021836 [Elasticomyces elasticus]KAK4911265.1 hypothetical protein LTR49_020153 [Elasticomyces elasticus]KAK5756313.1 hypothetical protein LTS12_013619 [Elasticomyces elasticus]